MDRLKNSKAFEVFAHILAILSFVAICWVASRVMQVRTQCLSSSFIAFVQIGSQRVENCMFESRLSLDHLLHPLSGETLETLRRLEVLEPLTGLFASTGPNLAVEVNLDHPRIYELGRGYVRLGSEWLEDPVQTDRGLIMGVLKRERPQAYGSDFELEVMTDFLMMTVMGERPETDAKLPTSAPTFEEYCKSGYRSLAHYEACSSSEPGSEDMQQGTWGFRQLLATAMARMYVKSSLKQKLKIMRAIRLGRPEPDLPLPRNTQLATMIDWFNASLRLNLGWLEFAANETTEWNLKSTLKELEVESPIRWELTVDITNTPAWREVLAQFKSWSKFHPRKRTLVFTPDGAVVLPSGMPMPWSTADIQSQTHVLIACEWPDPKDVVSVSARHVYARQSCGKMNEIFWN